MSEQPPDKKRVTPTNLARALSVVVAVQLVALVIAQRTVGSYQAIVNASGPTGPAGPAGNTAAGSALNVILLVGFAFVATLALVWVLRRRMVKSFKVLIFGTVSFSAFFINLITFDSFVYGVVSPDLEVPLVVGVSLALVALIGFTVFVRNVYWLSTAILALVGAEVGSFFAFTLPLSTALLLPVAFSLYDIYAVFRGPLKQLIAVDSTVALVGMSIKAGEFTLGLGDVVFYTMLPAIAFRPDLGLGPYAPFEMIAGIDVGVVVTLYLLSKKKLLPGLPIPMLLGLVVLVLAYYL